MTSDSISSCTTESPTPTESASSPSLAAPTSSPSASWICGGSGLSDASIIEATFATGTFFMAVPPVSVGLHSPRTLPIAADGAGGASHSKFYELSDNLRNPSLSFEFLQPFYFDPVYAGGPAPSVCSSSMYWDPA